MSARGELLLLDGSDEWPAKVDRVLAQHRTEVLAEAIEAARAEYLTDATESDEDNAYNNAITDAVAAIGRLLEGGDER